MSNFAPFSNEPPYFKRKYEAFYDEGNGIPTLEKDNVSIQDMYKTPFLFLQDHHRDYHSTVDTALKGLQAPSELSRLFFSEENIKRIQKKIKRAVLDRTNGKYRLDTDQDVDDIIVCMRSVYIEFGKYQPEQIVRQVKRLNDKVVDETVPSIITNIKQYYGYLADITNPIKPLDRPINVNNAGRRTLPSVTTRFEGGVYNEPWRR